MTLGTMACQSKTSLKRYKQSKYHKGSKSKAISSLCAWMVAYSLPSIGQTNEALIHGAEGISTVISKDGR